MPAVRLLHVTLATALAGVLAAGCTAILGIGEPGGAGTADGGTPDAPIGGDDAAPYAPQIAGDPDPLRVARDGATAQLVIDLGQPPPAGVAVTVTLEGLPVGVLAPMVDVTAPDSQAVLAVDADATAVLGPHALTARVAIAGASDTAPVQLVVADLPGTPDTTFGGDGLTAISVGGLAAQGTAVGVLADGKIIVGLTVAGNWTLVRFNEDGTVDTDFGTAGVLTYQAGTLGDLVVLPSGKILVVGSIGDLPGIVRFHPDGQPDDGFGSSGKVTFFVGTQTPRKGYAVAVGAAGEIYVAGDQPGGGGGTEATVYRISAAGTYVNETAFAACARFSGIVVQPVSGRAVAVCTVSGQPTLVGFNSLAIDDTFGTAGSADLGTFPSSISDLAVRADGRLVASGTDFSGPNDWRLFGADATGAADPTFGAVTGGVFDSANDDASAVMITPDGQVVGVLNGFASFNGSGGLVRYDASGALDTGFGVGGVAKLGGVDFEPKYSLRAVTVDSLGRYIAVGNRSDSGLLIVRVWN